MWIGCARSAGNKGATADERARAGSRLQVPDLGEHLPNHRHRNLKAFEEHLQKPVSSRFVTEYYL